MALASIASRFPSVQDDNSWINSLAVFIDDSHCSAMDEVPLSIEHIWWKTSLPLRRGENLPSLRGAPRKKPPFPPRRTAENLPTSAARRGKPPLPPRRAAE